MNGRGHDRPLVGVSSCLLGENVRWNGGHKRNAAVTERLADELRLLPVCPELECGLGVPRPPLVLAPGTARLLERKGGIDHSETMRKWAGTKLDRLAAMGLAGYILKARSPSCALVERHGFFTRLLLARFPGMPTVDESMLADEAACRDLVARARAYAAR